MLKSLHLKNWRSIREATIEFTPITVLIGENASGKTNILDALYFMRETMESGLVQAVYRRQGGSKIKTLGLEDSEASLIDYVCKFPDSEVIKDSFALLFEERNFLFQAKRTLKVADTILINEPYIKLPSEGFSEAYHIPNDATYRALEELFKHTNQSITDFLTKRWQLLDENFMPPLSESVSNIGDLYVIDRCADNLVFMLDFMKQTRPELHESLQEDLQFLLGHVNHISSKRDEHEVHVAFHENKYPEKEAPTVSAGTARILAVLAAIYALDMRNPTTPGLVVIEEPETSLNPSLLRKFVELLRGYTQDAEKPRQFILTTHNPAFLNYFEPEEVRVVSRDEDGNTVVNPIPDYIREIWLDEHGLGDAWLTNAFGGVAE